MKVGSIEKLKNGDSHLTVMGFDGEYPERWFTCQYNNSVRILESYESDFELVTKEDPQVNTTDNKETQEMTNTLYQFTKDGDDTKQLFGTKLAVNSSGMWVMEEKGTGLISLVTKDKVLEVMPNTISVVFKEGGQVYSYFAEAGKFKAGSFYLMNSQLDHVNFCIVKVTAVDTKSKSATKDFTPIAELSTLIV